MMQIDSNQIIYKIQESIQAEQYIELLGKTSLGARRPIDDFERIQGVLAHSNLLITAWVNHQLIGLARSVTDFYYCCYLSDLAIAEDFQKLGIGKKLVDLMLSALQPNCHLILLAAPQATGYYSKIGFQQHPSAWVTTQIG